MATFPQWEYDLLKALGAPASQPNLTALNLWAQSEGSVTNNPLATSGKGAGASACVAQCGSTSPIYEYATEAQGVAHMASFLQGSNYTAIVRAFVQNSGLAAIYQAINNSKWCSGCQNGQYPIDLAKQVGGNTIVPASSTVGTGTGGPAGGGGSGGSADTSGLSTCVIQLPGFLFFSGPCFLTKGGVKWLSGAAALIAGVGLAGFGIVLLASSGFGSPGAKQAAGKVAKAAGAVRRPARGRGCDRGPIPGQEGPRGQEGSPSPPGPLQRPLRAPHGWEDGVPPDRAPLRPGAT